MSLLARAALALAGLAAIAALAGCGTAPPPSGRVVAREWTRAHTERQMVTVTSLAPVDVPERWVLRVADCTGNRDGDRDGNDDGCVVRERVVTRQTWEQYPVGAWFDGGRS